MIPKILHHIWVGPPMPDRLVPYVESWRTLHPTWEHRLWTGFDDLENQRLYDAAEKVTPHVGQFRSDLARYEILFRHGGVYVDCDLEALRPIDDLLDAPAFAGWEVEGRWVNNAILGAEPGHPLMRRCIDAIPGSVRRNRGKRPNVMTGPHLLTAMSVSGLHRDDFVIHPQTAFYPYLWSELGRQGEDFPESYAVHHWENARKRKGLVPS